MKLVAIMYNEALEDEILEIFEKNDIQGYTRWTKVYGKGKSSGPHLGTHTWPKVNNVMAVVMEEEKVSPVLERIHELRSRLSRQGVKAFVLPVEEIT